VVGHSFGGGVAIRLAHDARARPPPRADQLGGQSSISTVTLTARPYAGCAGVRVQFIREFGPDFYRIIQAVRDRRWNVVVNPWALSRWPQRRRSHGGWSCDAVSPDRRAVERQRRRAPQGRSMRCVTIRTDGRCSGGHSWLSPIRASPRCSTTWSDHSPRDHRNRSARWLRNLLPNEDANRSSQTTPCLTTVDDE
jgi:pimeloyl-ACP methyl ester carboxylesterase